MPELLIPDTQHGNVQVIEALQSAGWLKSVAIMPSLRDAHQLPVFPQPAMSAKAEGALSHIGNPATFQCGELTVGAVAADVLKHLSSQEIQLGNSSSDRLAALASHILWQNRSAAFSFTLLQICWRKYVADRSLLAAAIILSFPLPKK